VSIVVELHEVVESEALLGAHVVADDVEIETRLRIARFVP